MRKRITKEIIPQMNERESLIVGRLLDQISYLDFQLNNATNRDLVDPEGLREACSRFLDNRKHIIKDIKELESSLTRTVELQKAGERHA